MLLFSSLLAAKLHRGFLTLRFYVLLFFAFCLGQGHGVESPLELGKTWIALLLAAAAGACVVVSQHGPRWPARPSLPCVTAATPRKVGTGACLHQALTPTPPHPSLCQNGRAYRCPPPLPFSRETVGHSRLGSHEWAQVAVGLTFLRRSRPTSTLGAQILSPTSTLQAFRTGDLFPSPSHWPAWFISTYLFLLWVEMPHIFVWQLQAPVSRVLIC